MRGFSRALAVDHGLIWGNIIHDARRPCAVLMSRSEGQSDRDQGRLVLLFFEPRVNGIECSVF